MKYYQPLEFDYWESLQHNLLVWADQRNLIHTESKDISLPVDLNDLINCCPRLSDFTKEQGVKIASAHITRHRRTFSHDLRGRLIMGINKSRLIDQQHTRIELPLCGYEHSWLVFYRAKPLSKHTQDNGITYLLMDEESAVEVERVRVNQPMLITNIRPHKVVFDRPFLDRINIVLHTDPDLRQLLD